MAAAAEDCGKLPLTLIQALAACLVTSSGTTYVNTIEAAGACDGLTSFWTCANNGTDPESAIVANAFALDECGNLAIKIYKNTGSNLT